MFKKNKSFIMKWFIILFIFVFILKQNVEAQELDQYLQEAAQNNPEVKARFNEYLAAMEKLPQVGSLPNPDVTFGYFVRPMELLMGNQRAELSLMQMFPWFGMLKTQKSEAAIMAKAQYELFREAKNQLYLEIKETWYRLHQINEEIEVSKENLELLKTLERLALIKFQSGGGEGSSMGSSASSGRSSSPPPSSSSNSDRSGGGMGNMTSKPSSGASGSRSSANMNMNAGTMPSGSGMADVLRIQIEIKEIENNLESLKDAVVPLTAKLNALLNRNIEEKIVLSDTLLPRNLRELPLVLTDSILNNNPMSLMLDAEGEAYQVQQEMAKIEGRPMLGAGINYMIFSPRDGGEMGMMGGGNMFMPMVKFTLPIYRKRYKSLIKEAELNQEAANLQKRSVQNNFIVEWQEALKNLRDVERNIQLYRDQSQLAAQAMDIMLTSYAANGSSFEDILRVQQQLLMYQFKLIEAVVNQNLIVAKLESISTIDLD